MQQSTASSIMVDRCYYFR